NAPHLPMAVHLRPTLGAERTGVDGNAAERRAFELAEIGVLGRVPVAIETAESAVASPKIGILAGFHEAIEAIERRAKPARVDAELDGELFGRVGARDPFRHRAARQCGQED